MSVNCTEGTPEDWYKIWKTVHVLTLTLSSIPFLIFVSLVTYLVRKTKNSSPGRKRPTGRRYSTGIDTMCMVSALFTVLRVGLDLELIIGNDSDWGCIVSMRAKNVLYLAASMSMYFVLWLRQRVFYRSAALKHLCSITLQVGSWVLLCFIIVGPSVTITAYMLTTTYVTSDCGCDREDEARVAIYATSVACAVFAQVLLLALLLYPLLKGRANHDGVITGFIKRASISASICVVTDGASSIMALTLGQYEAYNLVYEVNLIVNLVAVVFSFPNWRNRFVPCHALRHRFKIREMVTVATDSAAPTNSIKLSQSQGDSRPK